MAEPNPEGFTGSSIFLPLPFVCTKVCWLLNWLLNQLPSRLLANESNVDRYAHKKSKIRQRPVLDEPVYADIDDLIGLHKGWWILPENQSPEAYPPPM